MATSAAQRWGASKEVTERGEVMTREDEEEYFGEGRVKGRGI